MNVSVSIAPETPTVIPTASHECATVLFLRNYISEKDKGLVEEVISQAQVDPNAATAELFRRGLILEQNKAAVAQFIKRAVRAIDLNVQRRKRSARSGLRARSLMTT